MKTNQFCVYSLTRMRWACCHSKKKKSFREKVFWALWKDGGSDKKSTTAQTTKYILNTSTKITHSLWSSKDNVEYGKRQENVWKKQNAKETNKNWGMIITLIRRCIGARAYFTPCKIMMRMCFYFVVGTTFLRVLLHVRTFLSIITLTFRHFFHNTYGVHAHVATFS